MRIFTALVIAALALPALAQSTAHPKPKDLQVVDDVPPPPRVEAGKSLPEPVVTTRKDGDVTIQEYRIGGKLYQQKVTPAKGPSYYLIDEKGEGRFTRVDGPEVKLSVPMWVILSW